MIDRSLGMVVYPMVGQICAGWEPGGMIMHATQPQSVDFVYRESRPFEVEMMVTLTNHWTFERSIIFEGLEPLGQGGIGDVQVYNDGEEFCYMRLESPEGWCVIRFRLIEMRTFAREMKFLVPLGEEKMNMDLVIAQIQKEAR